MGLTQKILLFTSLLVVALVVTSLLFTTVQSDRLARATIDNGLKETRQVWDTFQTDRYSKLKLGARVLANDPGFKAAIQNAIDHSDDPVAVRTVFDMLQERGRDLGAEFFIATDTTGVVIARSDKPGAQGTDLSKDPLVMKAIEGEQSATLWRQGDKLYHAVSVPMQTGPNLVGVLVAGYEINEALAGQIRKLTHSEIAYLVHGPNEAPQLSVSSLGPKEADLRAALGQVGNKGEMAPFELDVGNDPHIGVQVPLKAATGDVVGSVLALRSLAEETASFRQFRNSLILVAVVVMIVGLGLASVASSRITTPVRKLADMVERARDGSYTGAVAVNTSDEIGVLARTFNNLLADLRQKDQMIDFLRDEVTISKQTGPGTTVGTSGITNQPTAALAALTVPSGAKVQKGSLFAGRYEILEGPWKGGMGVVYRALDQQLDEVVALKVLRAEALAEDPTMLERFKREIKLARRITHRNVVRIHDFGEAEGASYISMEFVDGKTLKDLVRSKGALPLGVGLSIAKQMCMGLEAAHAQQVVHRDIKPQNVMIIPESAELKLMDFGIARSSEMKGEAAAAAGLTSDGTVMGTPDYMPPEQAQGQPADFRSDIYSMGVVFFEAFTGALPFSGDTIMAIVLGHIQKAPPRPRNMNPRIPEALEAVILRCLEKSPARRYATVDDVLEDLTTISSGVEAA